MTGCMVSIDKVILEKEKGCKKLDSRNFDTQSHINCNDSNNGESQGGENSEYTADIKIRNGDFIQQAFLLLYKKKPGNEKAGNKEENSDPEACRDNIPKTKVGSHNH